MEDEAHVRLVDAHAKGDGGADDDALLRHEQVLRLGPVIGTHAGVIGDGAIALGHEVRREFLRRLPRQRIDDAALALAAIEEIEKLLLGAVLGRHHQADVGAVEARDEHLRLAAEDLAARCRAASPRPPSP